MTVTDDDDDDAYCECPKHKRIIAKLKKDAIDASCGVYRRRPVLITKHSSGGTSFKLAPQKCQICQKEVKE